MYSMNLTAVLNGDWFPGQNIGNGRRKLEAELLEVYD
jgi:hypothetical protein